MKNKPLKNWANIKDTQGLLFFAEVLDELLFDYTLDSYKPLALNVRVLCWEALKTVDHIKSGLIKPQNLQHIIEELKWSMNSDFVAKQMLGKNLVRFEEQLNNSLNNLSHLKQTLLLMYHYFDNKKYLGKIKLLLKEKINNSKEKEAIYYLTKIFVTELINYGYNRNHIYFKVRNFFFEKNEISTNEQISIFFNLFDFEVKKYQCIFKGSKLFLEFSKSAEGVDIKIESTQAPLSSLSAEKKFYETKKDDEIFIVVDNVAALDFSNARTSAETRIDRLANLFTFFHHKEKPKVSDEAVVFQKETKYAAVLGPQIKSIIKKQDVEPKFAAIFLDNILNNLTLSKTTLYQIGRAIDLHSISLESSEIENQLLNFWTAFETLIPKNETSGQDRIVQLADSIVPFLVCGYNRKIISQFVDDLRLYNSEFFKEISSEIIGRKGVNYTTDFAALIATKENSGVRGKIYNELEGFPLLKFRLFSLNKVYSNAKILNKALQLHEQKIKWQIRRLYRTRNLIVHAGTVPPYTGVLVENIHNYLDVFLEEIFQMTIKEKKIHTINQGVIEIRFRVENYLEYLAKNAEEEVTVGNFEELIFP